MTSACKGQVLIINNIFGGDDEKERVGSAKDVANLKEVFTQMGFKVI